MLAFLQKFNELPEELKSQVSSDNAMKNIAELEKKYGFSLATVVMRVMVREISIVDLAKFFVFENKLDARQSEKLVEELKEKIFFGVANYLGFSFHRPESEKSSALQVDNIDIGRVQLVKQKGKEGKPQPINRLESNSNRNGLEQIVKDIFY